MDGGGGEKRATAKKEPRLKLKCLSYQYQASLCRDNVSINSGPSLVPRGILFDLGSEEQAEILAWNI